MMREANLEKKLREAITKLGGWAIKIESGSFSGLPDRLVLLPGVEPHFVELKTEIGTTSALQKAVHIKIEKLGTRVYVLHGPAEINKYLKEIKTC